MWIFLFALLYISQDLSLYLPETFEGYEQFEKEEFTDPSTNCGYVIKSYKKGNSEMIATLVDYKNGPEIFESTIKIWSSMKEVNNENIKSMKTTIKDYEAWETVRKEENASEIIIAVKGRYLLTIQCFNAPLNEAKTLAYSYNYNWLKR